MWEIPEIEVCVSELIRILLPSMDITGIKRQIFCCNRERYTVDLPGFSNSGVARGDMGACPPVDAGN